MRTNLSILFVTALAGVAMAQERSAVPDGLPWPKGVYVRAGGDWVGLPSNPLLPSMGGDAKWLLGFGHSDAIAEMPGPHALIQIGNAKPVFYVRGLPEANGIYLVRSEQREDYRRVRMPMSSDFRQFTKKRPQDVVEMEMRAVSGDVMTMTPKSDLKPGEYAIISVFDQNIRQVRAGFEFGVTNR